MKQLDRGGFNTLLVPSCSRSCSVVSDSVTSCTVARQAPLSMRFPRQESWSGLPFPVQGILLTQGLKQHLLCLPHWLAGSLPLRHLGNLSSSIRKTKCTPVNVSKLRNQNLRTTNHRQLDFPK